MLSLMNGLLFEWMYVSATARFISLFHYTSIDYWLIPHWQTWATGCAFTRKNNNKTVIWNDLSFFIAFCRYLFYYDELNLSGTLKKILSQVFIFIYGLILSCPKCFNIFHNAFIYFKNIYFTLNYINLIVIFNKII